MAYNPSLFIAQNIPFAPSDIPLNAKSLFFDTVNFKFRPYVNIAEVNLYLNILAYRDATFDVIINTGGTLVAGVITGGVNDAYWYKDGTANANLVLKTNSVDLTGYYTKTQIDAFLVTINASIAAETAARIAADALKADKTYVDAQDEDLQSQIDTKADKSDINTPIDIDYADLVANTYTNTTFADQSASLFYYDPNGLQKVTLTFDEDGETTLPFTADASFTGTLVGITGSLANVVTYEQVTVYGKNNFNKATVTAGKAVNEVNGNLSTNAGYDASDYMDIERFENVTISNFAHAAFYDDNHVFIPPGYAYNIAPTVPINTTKVLAVPVGAVYLRADVVVGGSINVMQVEGGTEKTSYVPYVPPVTTYPMLDFVQAQQITDELRQDIYDNIVLPPEIVTPEETNFAETVIISSKNLFNDNTAIAGKYINWDNGVLSTNAIYTASDWIAITPETEYYIKDFFHYAQYDINKIFIAGSGENVGSPSNKSITTVEDAYFLRGSTTNALVGSMQIELGDVFTGYEAWFEPEEKVSIPNLILPDAPDVATAVDFVLPKKLYLLKSNQNTVYFKQITNKWKDDYYLRVTTDKGFINMAEFARVTNPVTAGLLQMTLFNEDFESVSTLSTTLVLGDPAVGASNVNWNAFGNSYTYNGTYQTTSKLKLPLLTTVGTRASYNDPLIKNEGHGGWKASNFFDSLHSTSDGFTPLMHPSGYLYFGNTDFWIKARAATSVAEYNYYGFKPMATTMFNTLGFKATPSVNDLMYDDLASTYKYWNGSAWTAVSLSASDFVVNYAKYRSAWSIPTPHFVSMELGVNDFVNIETLTALNDMLPLWISRVEAFIDSVHADTPTAKFLILLPPANFGGMNNTTGNFTKRQQFIMFNAKKIIIDNFDEREAELIYTVDCGANVDPEYGYTTIDPNTSNPTEQAFIKPFAEYTGTDKRVVYKDHPHPSTTAGYSAFGIPPAAAISALRP